MNILIATFCAPVSNRAEIYINSLPTPPFNTYAMSTASVPSQPPLNEAYKQPSNPASKNPSEANPSHSLSGPKVETRKLNDVTVEATPTALGYGVRDSSGDRGDKVLRNNEYPLFRQQALTGTHANRSAPHPTSSMANKCARRVKAKFIAHN